MRCIGIHSSLPQHQQNRQVQIKFNSIVLCQEKTALHVHKNVLVRFVTCSHLILMKLFFFMIICSGYLHDVVRVIHLIHSVIIRAFSFPPKHVSQGIPD